MPLIALAIGAGITWKLLASGAEDAGQAIDAGANGALKIVLAGSLAYAGAKYYKII